MEREEEIQARIRSRQKRNLPEQPNAQPTQRLKLRETLSPTNIEPASSCVMSLTVDAGEGIGNIIIDTAPWTSLTIHATPNIEEGSLRSGKEMEVELQQ